MKDFAIGGQGDGAGAVNGGAHILARDLAQAVSQADAALAVDAAHVGTAQSYNAVGDDGIGHLLGFGSGLVECPAGRLEIADQALAHAFRVHHAVRAIAQRTFMQLRNQHANFGAAGIQYRE